MWKIMLTYSRFNIFNVWLAFEHKYGFGADAYACIVNIPTYLFVHQYKYAAFVCDVKQGYCFAAWN